MIRGVPCLGPERMLVLAPGPLPVQQPAKLLSEQLAGGWEFHLDRRVVNVVESYLGAELYWGGLASQGWLGAWLAGVSLWGKWWEGQWECLWGDRSFGQSSTGHVHVSHSKAVGHPLTMYLVGCYIVYTLCGDNSLRQHTMLFFRILLKIPVYWYSCSIMQLSRNCALCGKCIQDFKLE